MRLTKIKFVTRQTDKTEEVRRLGMGRLLDDLTKKMATKASQVPRSSSATKSSANETDPPRFLVHSTHDTALAALLSTLDVYDEKYVGLSCLENQAR